MWPERAINNVSDNKVNVALKSERLRTTYLYVGLPTVYLHLIVENQPQDVYESYTLIINPETHTDTHVQVQLNMLMRGAGGLVWLIVACGLITPGLNRRWESDEMSGVPVSTVCALTAVGILLSAFKACFLFLFLVGGCRITSSFQSLLPGAFSRKANK